MTLPLIAPRGLLDRFTSAVRDANTWKTFMGITEANQDDVLTFDSVPADEAWVYACVSRLANAAASVPLRVYVRVGGDLIPAVDYGDPAGTACQYLLDNVNPLDMNAADLKAYTMASWAVWGGAYWQKVRGRLAANATPGSVAAWPKELYWLRVPDVRPFAPDGRFPLRYDYYPKGGSFVSLDPSDMVPFRAVNLADPLTMLSPLSSVRHEISVNRNAAIHTAAELKNGGVPAMAIVPDKTVEVSDTDRRIVSRIMKAARGPQNAGKMPVLPPGFDFRELSLHSADAQWIEARQISRKAICAVLHVPPVIAGDDDKTNVYGNIRDARKVFWLDGVIPRLTWIADTVNNYVTSEFDPTRQRLVAAFDVSEVEALQDPWPEQVNAWLNALERTVVVPNEVRTHIFRMKPRAGGDKPIPLTRVTLKGDAMPGAVPGTYIEPDEPVPSPPLVIEPGGGTEPELPDTGAMVRAVTDLYRQPAVRSYLATPSQPLDTVALFGRRLGDSDRLAIEAGLRRRYSAAQIVVGVPAEGYAGLSGV